MTLEHLLDRELLIRARRETVFGFLSQTERAPGGSRVSVKLADDPHGTRLALRHECADAAARDAHVPGWRYQLAVLVNAAADAEQAGLTRKVDAFFAAWNEGDSSRRPPGPPRARCARLAEPLPRH